MYGIKDSDYEYVSNKYYNTRDPEGRIGSHVRRNDGLFKEETGLSPEEIISGIREVERECQGMSRPEIKAQAIAFVLKNTRISCDPRDIFPAINMIDRQVEKYLIGKWSNEVFSEKIPEVGERMRRYERSGKVTIWPDYCHTTPVWRRVLSLGFAGLLRESEAARQGRTLTEEQTAFFEGIRISYEAIIGLVGRMRVLAEETLGSERLARGLKTLECGAPGTFYEALLTIYLYFMISEYVDGVQVRSLSNFDRMLYPFYKSDLEGGVSEEELRSELAYFLLQFTAINNYWNQPVYLGGENADGTTVINELSYVFLDVYDKMNIYNPKIQIKVSDSTPREFLFKALDMIRRGHNSIVFIGDKTVRAALERFGATADEARLANITGCYEYSVDGSYGSGMNYLNLLKPLEYALHGGRDGITGEEDGLECKEAEEYGSFDELYAEYKRQLLKSISDTVEVVNSFEGYLGEIEPLSILSATFPTCLERGKDAISGGALRNDSSILFGFLADAVDSLTMIKKYVFDKKQLSLSELVGHLDSDFREDGKLRLRLLSDREKYGNNKAFPDGLASDIVKLIGENLNGIPNAPERGGKWSFGFHVARQSYDLAPRTATSANGRLRGEELSKNLSASMGQNREGATAAILSVTKIDATSFPSDAPLDLGLLPSAVSGEDGLAAMYGLLMTFVHRMGHALHINVFNADTLRAAQREPEKYRDLQIRVCGWNVLWNNINKEEQEGFIRQAEALV